MSRPTDRRPGAGGAALPAAFPGGGRVPSPCISVCRMNPSSGWCEGCFRTIDEIAGWGAMSESDKLRVWGELQARRQRAAAAG